jgi:hypothetical protein
LPLRVVALQLSRTVVDTCAVFTPATTAILPLALAYPTYHWNGMFNISLSHQPVSMPIEILSEERLIFRESEDRRHLNRYFRDDRC